jgi:AraC-like DNA-binding protein
MLAASSWPRLARRFPGLAMTDRYQQFRPIDTFRPIVDAYWINRRGGFGASDWRDRVLPDGCIDLVFRGGARGAGRLFSSALIDRPLAIHAAAHAWFVGVRFRPAMAGTALALDPVECRDRDIPAASFDIGLAALEDRLNECRSPDEALAILRRALDARVADNVHRMAPPPVPEALALLARGGDAAHVHRVARDLGLSERGLHRLLVRWTGLAPKPMARILRMQRTLAAIRAGQLPLAAIALAMGYADQAHMTRELRQLTGSPPSAFAVRNLQDAA